MSDLTFDLSWERAAGGDPLEDATSASFELRVGGLAVTQVVDQHARTTRDVIRVPLFPLAVWFAANWWRLRWEGYRLGTDWDLSHRLASVGGGSVWPDVTFSSDGEAIEVLARRSAPDPVSPVHFLNETASIVPAPRFEARIDAFVESVLARLDATGHERTDLHELWSCLREERSHSSTATQRRFEALLGYDPGEADAALLAGYARGAERFGEAASAELAASADNGMAPDWDRIEQDLQDGQVARVPDLNALRSAVRAAVDDSAPPWKRGEAAAGAVRSALRRPTGPLTNRMLEDWLGADPDSECPNGTTPASLARRSGPDEPSFRVRYRGRHADGRRFEFARLLCDHLLSAPAGDTLLPATRGRTARQSVQRAFAAELLLPWEDLRAALGPNPEEEAMEDVARRYHVSPLVVRTRMVTKGRLSVDALDFAPDRTPHS